MGGSQSQDQQERVITVEERESPDGEPQITVTQEFLNYLYEAKSGSRDQKYQEEGEEEEVPYISAEDVLTGEPEYSTVPGRESEEGVQWRLKYEQERKKNEDLKNLSSKEFSAVVGEVREKFKKTPLHDLLPVCDDCKEEVLDCYHSNPGKTLNCSGEVKKFIECIERARKGLLHVSSKS